MLLDSFVLKNPSEVIDLSFLVMTPLRYGSDTSFLAVNLAAGLTTSSFCVNSLASWLTYRSVGKAYDPLAIYLYKSLVSFPLKGNRPQSIA